MKIPRIFLDLELGENLEICLDASQSNHIVRVLRLKEGAELIVFNGRGGQYQATITATGKRETRLLVNTFSNISAESPLDITLLQAVSKGERMDYAIQKSTELGVNRIIPIFSERSVVRIDAKRLEKKLHHWQQVVISACEQCGRNTIPDIGNAISFTDAIAADRPGKPGYILDPESRTTLTSATRPETDIHLLVGPEGGFSENEVRQALAAGYTGISLGPRILRTETAAVSIMTAMQLLWGDLG